MEPEIETVTRRLEATLNSERRKALEYTLLTVLCTPAFAVIGAVFAVFVAAYIVHNYQGASQLDLDTMTFYTALNFFLAYMVAATIRGSNASTEDFRLEKMWLFGVILLVVLLVLTYATSLPRAWPRLFGVTYAVLGFLTLGFVSQVLPPDYALREENPKAALALAIPNLITSAYRELFSASWLWFPPQPAEVRVAARLLCKLAADQDNSLSRAIVDEPIRNLLSRLALIRVTEQSLHLTAQGLDFLRTAEKGGHDRGGTMKF
ncbi:MAG: hypothetical protein MUC88_02175 [Planctomycetes bacterium]|jgi:hypothetical protein|nr:hypothetical protein [Planctomycetota bacterium]